ncbi:LysM peptidoglycan-binding domain-containing protein [Aestuariibacter salexigens]|uniref:LysM peptidoglycan-binding domain-containing protein n=1 Tax=Aestuariibacter salexigens TaxID=226010 RepID=UPI00047B9769|nr:LysM domain-containing protein [Aestuariibacter salexigens]
MRLKRITWLVLAMALCFAGLLNAMQIKSDAPQVYVVKEGDTLWDISSLFLDKPWLWPELWRNNTHITNPHLIYPGDELRLRYDDQGQPVMDIVRAEEKPRLVLSPAGKRTSKANQAIPLLPWSVIEPYLANDMILEADVYEQLPHLLGDHNGSIRFANDDLILSGIADSSQDEYRVLRMQSEVVDRFDNVLGVMVRHVADVELSEAQPDSHRLVRVKQANFELKRGDKLLPQEEVEYEDMRLEAATRQRGFIVDSLHQHGLLGKYDIVVVDLGQREVKPGTVMGIYAQGPNILDGEQPIYESETNIVKTLFSSTEEVTQPAVKIGELVVFKTFNKASYGLITRSREMVRQGAIVAAP